MSAANGGNDKLYPWVRDQRARLQAELAALDAPATQRNTLPHAYLRLLAGAAALAAAAALAWVVLWQPTETAIPQPGFDATTQAQWSSLRAELRKARTETRVSLNQIAQVPTLQLGQEPLTSARNNLTSLGRSQMDALATELAAPVAQFIEQTPELQALLRYAAREDDPARG